MLIANDTTRVTIGNDWYDLQTQLGWYEAEIVYAARHKMLVPVTAGRIVMDGVLEVRLETAPAHLAQLQAQLVAWSHPEELTAAHLKRLPPAHADALLAKIKELEAAEAALELTEPEKNSPGG